MEAQRYWHTYANSEEILDGEVNAFVVGPFPDGSRIEELWVHSNATSTMISALVVELVSEPGTETSPAGLGLQVFPRQPDTLELGITALAPRRVLHRESVPRGYRFVRLLVENGTGITVTYSAIGHVSSPASPLP